MIGARLRAGRRLKAEQGGYAYGSPPYGLRAEDGVLIPDEPEQATVRRILALRAEGRSLREIASTLTAEDIPAKRGSQWHATTVNRILSRVG